MSASEIIERIKTLPRTDQAEVIRFVDGFRKQLPADRGAEAEPIEAIADRLFDRYDPLFKKLAE